MLGSKSMVDASVVLQQPLFVVGSVANVIDIGNLRPKYVDVKCHQTKKPHGL